jgi:mRNA-degrading endonuclease RelE of RelBE toxin-antitoxin system
MATTAAFQQQQESNRAMFGIEFTPEALDDLRLLRKGDQQRIIAGIESELPHQADQETRNRKRLRPNAPAEWELRIGSFRVFYDMDEENQMVKGDFDEEIARTRQNAKLMALLDERAKQSQTVPLDEVKRQLGLSKGS